MQLAIPFTFCNDDYRLERIRKSLLDVSSAFGDEFVTKELNLD